MDVESGELKFWVSDDEVTFNVCISMKHFIDIRVVSTDDFIDEVVDVVSHMIYVREPLEAILINYD